MSFGRKNVARSGRASALCDDIEHSARRLTPSPDATTPTGRGRAILTGDADTNDFGAV